MSTIIGVPALPFCDSETWRWRWMHTVNDRSVKMHRIASVSLVDDDGVTGPVGVVGSTLCGLAGRFAMPGLFSRMGGDRCTRCAKKAGVMPEHRGVPFNVGEWE